MTAIRHRLERSQALNFSISAREAEALGFIKVTERSRGANSPPEFVSVLAFQCEQTSKLRRSYRKPKPRQYLLDNTGASSPLAEVMVALASCYLVHRLSSATNADSIS